MEWRTKTFTKNGPLENPAEKGRRQIAELKKKLMPCLNGDCILTCEVVEKYGKENAELKQKLEDAKASHYAEMVDAGMSEAPQGACGLLGLIGRKIERQRVMIRLFR